MTSNVDHEKSEEARVAALRSYDILDTVEDSIFDAITASVARLFNVPISLVSLVDDKRQWFKSHHGLEARETDRQIAFCNHAIQDSCLFLVPDARVDARFAQNPLVTSEPNIRFYAGVPLFSPDGHGLGTLCAIDSKPRELSEREQRILRELAKLAESALETHRRMSILKAMGAQQQSEKERKELLAAMVVHDLRNPLGSITAAASWGSHVATEPNLLEAFSDILLAALRMEALVGDILDICLAEAGGLVARPKHVDMVALVQENIGQQARTAALKSSVITLTEAPDALAMHIDPLLIGRALTNLLDNAIKFSPQASNIDVQLRANGNTLELAIHDQGPRIQDTDRDVIFNAHQQGLTAKAGSGYGLGLAFCRLAAEVHAGSIDVDSPSESTQSGNLFILRLPMPS